jgi:hypothetical protein
MVIRKQASPEYVANFGQPRYPGQIPVRLVIAEGAQEKGDDTIEMRKPGAVNAGHKKAEKDPSIRAETWIAIRTVRGG